MEKYIKSPINYIGNKYKLISQIENLFPKKINTFIDVFGGSGTVLINTKANNYIYNDINPYISDIFEGLIKTDYNEIIEEIEKLIKEYNLSKTNKNGFEQLRDRYNSGQNDWVTLYTLMCHSFNHQFRFNNKHKYNSSFGNNRAYFSNRQKLDLKNMKEHCKNILFMSKNFDDIDYSIFNENDFIYFDPPYYNSVGNYNDGKRGFEGWKEEHEKKLLSILNKLNDRNIRWALSNNLKYNNQILKEWINNNSYNIFLLQGNHVNCSYNKIDRSKDIEILITNYNN